MSIGAWLFDLLDNVGTISMVSIYPSEPGSLAWITMLFGTLKWAFAFLVIRLVLVGFVRAAMNGFTECRIIS
jgi:hypothetical protein